MGAGGAHSCSPYHVNFAAKYLLTLPNRLVCTAVWVETLAPPAGPMGPAPGVFFFVRSDSGADVYNCYLDESGVVENAGTSHFVLLGLAIPAETWRSKDAAISDLKLTHRLGTAEIHAA